MSDMSKTSHFELNDEEQDALQELGNIGAGNALTALTQLIGEEVQIALPSIRVMRYRDLARMLECDELDYASVSISFHGELLGTILFVLNEHFTDQVTEHLTGERMESLRSLSELQASALCEIGNIMCNAYLNALASMLSVSLEVSVPQLSCGRGDEVLFALSGGLQCDDQEILVIENTFTYTDQVVRSHIVFHPQHESVQAILERMAL